MSWDPDRTAYELALLTSKKGAREKVILEARFLRPAKGKNKHLEVTEDTIGESGEGISGTAESLEALASYHEHMADVAADDSDAKSFEQTGLELTMASGGLGSITAGISGVAAFIGFVHNVRELIEGKDKDTLVDQILGGVKATGNLANAAAAPGSSLASTARMVTAAADSIVDNDATKEAMSTFSGIAGGLDAVRGAVTTITDGVATVTGIIKLVNKHADASGAETFSDGLATLEGVVRTCMSTISSVNGFLELANVGGTLGASVVPILGPAANIFLKLLLIVHKLVDMVLKVIDVIRLHRRRNAMGTLRDGDPHGEHHHLFSILHDVNDHRFDGQLLAAITEDLIPILTSMGSVLGSVLQIVGTATACAYGAGVGLMAGGTAITGAAAVTGAVSGMVPSATKGVHRARQYLRDVKANEKDGWFAGFVRDVHLDRWSKEEKSTGHKNEAYAMAVAQLFEVLRDLPKFDGDHKSPKTEIGAQYKHAHVLVRATGVSTKALYKETSLDKMARMLVDALKKRD